MVKSTQIIRRQFECFWPFSKAGAQRVKNFLISILKFQFNPFHANVSFLYPLKTSENKFSGVFSGHRNGILAWNGGLVILSFFIVLFCLCMAHKWKLLHWTWPWPVASISRQCFISVPTKNVRKQVFWSFQWAQTRNISVKWRVSYS